MQKKRKYWVAKILRFRVRMYKSLLQSKWDGLVSEYNVEELIGK